MSAQTLQTPPGNAPVAPRTTPARRPPLRAEALRGFAPWAGAAFLVALVWGLVFTADQWQGSWGETSGRLAIGAGLIGAPFALAAGAWQGGREHRRGMTELRASVSRTPLAQLSTAALPLAGWLVTAYLAAVAGALLACAPYASAGAPEPTVFAGTAIALAACSLLGHVIGRVAPWRLTAPALALAAFVLFGMLNGAQSALRYLALAFVRGSHDDLHLWWYPLALAVWTTGLAVAAALAHAARRRATALLPLTAALGAAVLLVQTGDGLVQENPLARHQVCDDSTTPRVCVNATYPGMLPEVADALSGLTGRLRGVRNLPVRFEDRPGEPHRDEAQLPMLTPFGWSAVRARVTDPEQYTWEAALALVRQDCDGVPSAERVRTADAAMVRWLAPRHLDKELHDQSVASARQRGDDKELARLRAEDKAYEHLTAMSDDQRRTWLSTYFATARDCDPDPKEVPAL
ncbi:hypothetical protein [Streptomyces sp. NPDC005485]|uniref:hypothetical protein n=1 Tax=Streptomyces sp. NPDC005485 TaxID=3155591 RepID=UPI0033BE7202